MLARSASRGCLGSCAHAAAVLPSIARHSGCGSRSPVVRAAQSQQAVLEAAAAFNASLERIVNATSCVAGGPCGAERSVEESSSEIGRLALLHSTQRRYSRTHMNTVNMSTQEDDSPASKCDQLPLSQLAFKSLLRASLAAARLNHSFLTTPHMLLGLLSAGSSNTSMDSSSSSSRVFSGPACLAPAAGRYAEAEAAVRVMIDGPRGAPVSPAVGAAASLLGQSCGLDVVTWCGLLSTRAQAVLAAAEQLRQQQGHPLLTSSHLLAALLQDSSATSSQPWVSSLLAQLGLDAGQMVAQLQQQMQQRPTAAAAGPGPSSEDAVLAEPVGFLHEEFYQSLVRGLSPSSPAAYSLN